MRVLFLVPGGLSAQLEVLPAAAKVAEALKAQVQVACDPKAAGWQEELSERMLGRLRALHEAHGIPYRYGEWRAMLAHFAA